MLMVFFTGLSGCLDNACDIQGEIDNSLGYTDDVVVHLVIKDVKPVHGKSRHLHMHTKECKIFVLYTMVTQNYFSMMRNDT